MAWYSGYQHPYQGFSWTWAAEKNHSGIDLPASCGTPMTAILPGKVIIAGQYPCYGGQVSIQSTFAGMPIVYTYLHGSSHTVNVGQNVQPGQLIGYSNQPIAAACGSGCHIHFEVEHGNQAPYTGGPPQNSSAQNYPINPVPLLAYAATGKIAAFTSGIGANFPSGSNKTTSGVSSSGTTGAESLNPNLETLNKTSAPSFNWGNFLSAIGGFLANPASILSNLNSKNPLTALEAGLGNLGGWVTNPIRIVKLMVGIGLIGFALLAVILPTAAPIVAGGTAAIAAGPEAALPAYSAARSLTYRRRRGEPRPQPAPASQTVPAAGVSVQRSYTTRRLRQQQRAQATGPIAAQPAQPAQPAAQPFTTTNPASGKRTLHVPMREPTEGPPGPGVQRMVPYTGPSYPSNPPKPRRVPAKPKAAYEAPPVARAATTTPLRAAPVTQPLATYNYGARTVQTSTPISDAVKDATSARILGAKQSSQQRSQREARANIKARRGKRGAQWDDILREFRNEKNK